MDILGTQVKWRRDACWESRGGRGGGCFLNDKGQPASLLVTKEDFLWGRSCGVGMWSPVTRFLSGPATGSCLFFILALAMLQSPESKYFCCVKRESRGATKFSDMLNTENSAYIFVQRVIADCTSAIENFPNVFLCNRWRKIHTHLQQPEFNYHIFLMLNTTIIPINQNSFKNRFCVCLIKFETMLTECSFKTQPHHLLPPSKLPFIK